MWSALKQMKEGFIQQGPRPNAVSVKEQKSLGNQKFQGLPVPTGDAPYHLSLDDILSPNEIKKIKTDGSMRFHCIGDTGGIKHPAPQQLVAYAMESRPASFFYHLGDVVYFYGESSEYYSQFYEPYQHYQSPIFAIPGNHDGDLPPHGGGSKRSLDAFVRNFCATSKNITPDAGEINRSPMIQPNVYWTLEAPYLTIVGLYTNVPEGGVVKKDQAEWFEKELESADKKKALIVALHHPVFSMDRYHSGSQAMLELLDNAIDNTGVIPDAVFTAHVHNYQRFTRIHKGNKKVPYIVAGAGGYWHLHWVQESVRSMTVPGPTPDNDNVTFEKYCDDHHGFMVIEVTPEKLFGEYYVAPNPQESWHTTERPERFDSFEFTLQKN